MNNKELLVLERILAGLLAISAGLSVIVTLYVIASRISYPYSVERMEGASLLQVLRILNWQKLYVQPSIEYTPLIYPPVYFYLSALAAKVLGPGFAPLRLVSSLAFVGCLVFIFRIIEQATKDGFSAFVGMSFFAATNPLSGIWFDVARVDSLFVFFCVVAIWFSSRDDTKGFVLSSLFWILAVFTKQTALIAVFASFAYLLICSFGTNIKRLSITGVFGLSAYLICTALWGKWFSYFVFYLPTFHQSQHNFAEIFTSLAQLILPLTLAILVSMFPFLIDRSIRSRQDAVSYYAFMTCALFGLAFLGRLNRGGFTNVYMPAHVMLAVMLGISLHWWKHRIPSDTPRSALALNVIYLICTLQFISLYFDPRSVIPTSAHAMTWSRFVDFIAAQEGNVLMPELNYLPAFADKPCFVNQVAVSEIFGEYGNPEPMQSSLLRAEIHQAIQEQEFSLVLLKDCDGAWESVANHYECHPLSQASNLAGLPGVILNEYQACYPVDTDQGSATSFD